MANRNGIANFSVTVGNRSADFLTIRVLPVNDPPTLVFSPSWTGEILLQENAVNVVEWKVATNLSGVRLGPGGSRRFVELDLVQGGWNEDQDMMFFSWKQVDGEPDLIRGPDFELFPPADR